MRKAEAWSWRGSGRFCGRLGSPPGEDEEGWDPALAATTIEGFGADEIVTDGDLR